MRASQQHTFIEQAILITVGETGISGEPFTINDSHVAIERREFAKLKQRRICIEHAGFRPQIIGPEQDGTEDRTIAFYPFDSAETLLMKAVERKTVRSKPVRRSNL